MSLSLLFSLAQTAAPGSPDPASLQNWNFFIMMGGVIIFTYVVILRPQSKRQKELVERVASLKTGDRVVTVGGIHGVVSNIKDGPTLILKVDDNCKLTVDKSAIVTITEKKE